MEEQTKKWVLIGVSIAGMGIFCYYTFYEPSTDAGNLINPARLEDSPSKQALNAEKRKKERKFDYDRKISSIDNFLKNEIEEDPFDTIGIVEADTDVVEKDTLINEAAPIEYRTIVKIVEQPSVVEEEQESERRRGFASGDAGEKPRDNDVHQPVNIAVVVQEDVMVVSGSLIKLRTLNTEGVESLQHRFLLGKARITGDRLYISVPEFTNMDMEEPVDLEAFDTNGLHGLPILGGDEITGRVMEDVVGEVHRNVDVPLLRDLPFTSARRKIREKGITLRSGTKLYLRAL